MGVSCSCTGSKQAEVAVEVAETPVPFQSPLENLHGTVDAFRAHGPPSACSTARGAVLHEPTKNTPDTFHGLVGAALASMFVPSDKAQLGADSTAVMNVAMERFWPYLANQWEEDVVYHLQNSIRSGLPDWVDGHISIDRFHFPATPCRFNKFTTFGLQDGLKLVAETVIDGDMDFQMNAGSLKLGINHIQVVGELVMELAPLLGERPIVGAMRLYFLNPPLIHLEFTGAARIAEFPCIRHCVRNSIVHLIEGALVQPNSFTQIFVGPNKLPKPTPLDIPAGVLRIRAVGAKSLLGSDWSMFQKATSDPYVQVQVGSDVWTSSTVKGTCDPQWDAHDSHDFVVYNTKQVVSAHVYDKDYTNDDDHLGCIQPRCIDEMLLRPATAEPLYRKATFLREGATLLDGEPKFGDLTLQYTWLKMGKPIATCGAALQASSQGFLLACEISHIVLPARTAKSVQVHLHCGDVRHKTPLVKTPKSHVEAAVAAVNSALKGIIENGLREGIPIATLAKVVNVEETVVHHMQKHLSTGGCILHPHIEDNLAERSHRHIMVEVLFNSKHFLPTDKYQLGNGHLDVECRDATQKVLAMRSFKLSDLGVSWPLIERHTENGAAKTRVSIVLDNTLLKGTEKADHVFELCAMFTIVPLSP